MEQTALVHKLGAEKYGAYNWRKTGVCASTYVHAILRHLNAWRDGEDNDRESGLSHIAHIGASCNILLDAAACGRLEDDRVKRPAMTPCDPESGWTSVEREPDLGEWLGPVAVQALEQHIQDPTQRIVPIPEGMLPLPDAPEGKKWVGRGRFSGVMIPGQGRVILWRSGAPDWDRCNNFSSSVFHIELIDDCHICGAEGYKCEHIPGVPF
jgi:hypothetical protein